MIPKLKQRRFRCYQVTDNVLSLLFSHMDGKAIRWCVISGPPVDANFISFHLDNATRSLKMLYEHPDFDVVPEGSVVPTFDLTIVMSDDPDSAEFKELIKRNSTLKQSTNIWSTWTNTTTTNPLNKHVFVPYNTTTSSGTTP